MDSDVVKASNCRSNREYELPAESEPLSFQLVSSGVYTSVVSSFW